MTYFTDIEQTFQKFIWNHKWPWIAAAIWQRRIKQEGSQYLISNCITRLLSSKQPGTGIKTGNIDQWNTTESPEINPSLYGQLIFDKGGRSIKWSKNSLFNKWCWDSWTATCKKMKFDHQLTPYTKINSRWIKDLNISCTTNCPRGKHWQENLRHSTQQHSHRHVP